MLFFILALLFSGAHAQLKVLVEDFEGMAEGKAELSRNGLFTYGNLNASIARHTGLQYGYAGERMIKLERKGKSEYGGWGKGVSLNFLLDQGSDVLNFYLLSGKSNGDLQLRVEIQEDDQLDGKYNKDNDDAWQHTVTIASNEGWQLVSLPLKGFRDATPGGDGGFNVGHYGGKLLVILFSLVNADVLPARLDIGFDFLCFSRGPLPHGAMVFDPPHAGPGDFCGLGAWSSEGNSANFVEIPRSFEEKFAGGKKLAVAHFFQSFSVRGDGGEYHYPSVERINRVIDAGYVPMITLEDHFVNAASHTKQPNLYSIVEGHFDSFFGYWAHQIKEVKGTVLLRILHEFNGDWYPWCTVKNDKNPELVARAFRYIHNIFRENNVRNVRFVWCPNSMSVPQEPWNAIMDAYPGDEFVDFVGLDIYNGAGEGEAVDIWRSFRREGIENYFLLTQLKPQKPLFVCEVASRERRAGESGQSKPEWIAQMTEALQTDMSKIRLLAWFDEKSTFKVASSPASQRAFADRVMKNDYFRSGKEDFERLFSGVIGEGQR